MGVAGRHIGDELQPVDEIRGVSLRRRSIAELAREVTTPALIPAGIGQCAAMGAPGGHSRCRAGISGQHSRRPGDDNEKKEGNRCMHAVLLELV